MVTFQSLGLIDRMNSLVADFTQGFPVGTVSTLVEGVHVLSLPMSFHPGHVNVYLLEDDAGLTLVDTGNARQDTREIWSAFLRTPLASKGIQRIILTHGHPDHSGHAEWLQAQTGAELWLTAPEVDAIRRLWRGSPLNFPAVEAFFLQWGLPAELFPAVQDLLEGFRNDTSDLPFPLREIVDGEQIMVAGSPWQVKCGYGHTPANATLWQKDLGLLITGDQLLPRIVPNISIWWGSSLNPLAQYLDSIQTFLGMGNLVGLPAHGTVFDDLDGRILQIIQFHKKRLVRALQCCSAQPLSAFDCIRPVLGKTEGGALIALIIGQVFALLAYLEGEGLMVRSGESVFRFQTVPGALERLNQLPVFNLDGA